VEVPLLQGGVCPGPDLQLPLALGVGHVDAALLQAAQVLGAVARIDEMQGPVTLVETFFDEGHEHAVLLLLAIEESTDVPLAADDSTCKPDLLGDGGTHDDTPGCSASAGPCRRGQPVGWAEDTPALYPPPEGKAPPEARMAASRLSKLSRFDPA